MGRDYKKLRGKENPRYKTGLTMQGSEKRGIYISWMNMKQRCLNSNHPKYKRYGGRGIKVYEPWLNIEVFMKWALENGWKKDLSIDRIDNDGDYCPENCQWLSRSANSRKKSTTKITIVDAENIRKALSDGECEYKLAKEYGVSHGTIWFIKNNIIHVEEGLSGKRQAERREKNKRKMKK